MSSCPESVFNPLREPNRFTSNLNRSTDSSGSLETSSEWDCECYDGIDFPFTIRIPTVVLRKARTKRAHFVYKICVTVRETVHVCGYRDRARNAPCLEWTVEHRYTTLESLHADLMGHTVPSRNSREINSSMEEDNNNVEARQEEKGQEDEPDHKQPGADLAHPCLPRPLPGLECFRFPRKRFPPTIPVLAAGRLRTCLKDTRDGENRQSAYVDYPVSIDQCHRVERRRRALELYLNRLIRLVWYVSQTVEVESVLCATGVESVDGQGREEAEQSDHALNEQEHLQHIKSRLISLLPILSDEPSRSTV